MDNSCRSAGRFIGRHEEHDLTVQWRFPATLAATALVTAAGVLLMVGMDRGGPGGELAFASEPSATPISLENPGIPLSELAGPGSLSISPKRSYTPEEATIVTSLRLRSTQPATPNLRFQGEKVFMLGLINEERRKAGVPEVSLGDNNAAQLHADNSARDCISSHWSTDGLGPEMRYSLAGGYQSQSENVAGLDYCYKAEDRSFYRPIESIETELREHMDAYMGSPGHRKNILRPWHRKLNLGLSWDTHQMWTVQQFEGDYLNCSVPPNIQGTVLSVTCTSEEVYPSQSLAQAVHFNPPPHTLTQGQVARVYSYKHGRRVALLRQKAAPGYSYPTDEVTRTYYSGCTPYDISPSEPPPSSASEAHRLYEEAKLCQPTPESITIPWIDGEESISGSTITLSHDIGDVLREHGDGVYTLFVWGCSVADSKGGSCGDGNSMVILEQSIFYGIDPPDTYSVEAVDPAETCGDAVADKSNTGLLADCDALLGARDVLALPLADGEPRLNWSADTPIAEWDGILEDSLEGSPRRVTRLYLNGLRLDGSIPPGLSGLAELKELYLHDNELSGPIPRELGALASLTHVHAYGNDLTGELPAELGNLSVLRELRLESNDLTGQLPPELGNLTRLTRLFLADNDLSGEIPAELGGMTSLDWLNLGRNNISGMIPEELGDLSRLRRLYLYENDLTGPIPSSLGSLSRLTHIVAQSNDLSGTLPPALGDLSNLVWMGLHDNDLTGRIPAELGDLGRLQRLYLTNNELYGEVPEELGSLSELTDLFLSFNYLEGQIPVSLADLEKLRRLRLAGNAFTGCLPAGLADVRSSDADSLGLPTCSDS